LEGTELERVENEVGRRIASSSSILLLDELIKLLELVLFDELLERFLPVA